MTSATLPKVEERDKIGMISFTIDATDSTFKAIDRTFDSNLSNFISSSCLLFLEKLSTLLKDKKLSDRANDEKSSKFSEFLGNELKKVEKCLKYFVEDFLEKIDISSDSTDYKFDKYYDHDRYYNYVLQTVSIKTWKRTNTKTINFIEKYNNIPVYGSLIVLEVLNKDDQEYCVDSIDSTVAKKNILLFIKDNFDKKIIQDNQIKEITKRLLKDLLKDSLKDLLKEVLEGIKLQPKLYYYFDNSRSNYKWRLVYFVEIKMPDTNKFHKPELNQLSLSSMADYVIDAYTGDVVNKISHVIKIR